MPELPEVQNVVDTIRPEVMGKRIVKILALRQDIVCPPGFDFESHLAGATIAEVSRRAKRIVFLLRDGARFYIHLGMTGQLTVDAAHAPIKKHTHLIAEMDDGRQLRFVDARRFGGIHWLGADVGDEIGPEPLTMSVSTFAKRLLKTRRAIKTALLDQKIIAGIGNIYADESLHAAGIHPLAVANILTPAQVSRLSGSIKKVLRCAIRAGGSTLRDYVNGRGERGSFQSRHKVYDRAGKPCKHCKSPIERAVVGGRSTHWCATCQKR
jgi:formamidopyrimidine-DNA glycosylase